MPRAFQVRGIRIITNSPKRRRPRSCRPRRKNYCCWKSGSTKNCSKKSRSMNRRSMNRRDRV